MITSKIFAFLFLVLTTSTAFAFPLPVEPMTAEKLDMMESTADLSAANFRSIVALSNCSGSLVRYKHSLGSDRAMIMTNGHCLDLGGFLKPGQVIQNKAVTRTFALLNESGSRIATLTADKILFGSMTHTDMALYQLTVTYDQIKQATGTEALILSPERSTESTPIAVVSGYWKKVYTCSIDKFIYMLKEDNWTFNDSIKYARPGCETIHGTSGSPIINTNTYEIIGINNTGNDDGQKCTMDNPCEIDQNGNVVVDHHASYGQQVHWVYGCLDQNRQINLNISGCKLKP